MNIEKLIKIVEESYSFTEVCIKLYGNKYCGNRITIKKYIKQNNININHFSKRYHDFLINFKKIPLSEILISGSTYNTTNLKERLYSEGLKERKCELCGQDEIWYGNKMSLILDHINGINNDHRYMNLRIVCPNCDATLPTFSGKNIKRKKKNTIINLQRKVKRPSYEQLQNEIKELGYSGTGRKYGVSDNAIRKWIKFYQTH